MNQCHWVGEFAIWLRNKRRVQTAKHQRPDLWRRKAMRDYLKVLFTSVALVGIGISLGRAEEELPSHKTIANRQHVEALGCEEESKTFTVDVPDPERLDRSYRGVMDGIELRLTESKNGCVGNFSFKNDHQITFSASAKGAGHWGNLNLFGRKGPRYCVGGAGGAITLDLIAHYK